MFAPPVQPHVINVLLRLDLVTSPIPIDSHLPKALHVVRQYYFMGIYDLIYCKLLGKLPKFFFYGARSRYSTGVYPTCHRMKRIAPSKGADPFLYRVPRELTWIGVRSSMAG